MSASEFDSLVALFLEGNASAEQVELLRSALRASPAWRSRFQASARLHQAQLACLSRREESSMADVLSWLHQYGQRLGRSFAHLCLLALVFVELQVTIPAEYTGLFSYVEAPPAAAERVDGDMPVLRITAIQAVGELTAGEENAESAMPLLASPLAPMPSAMPDMAMPAEPLTEAEV